MLALLDQHLLDLGGTYGDPEADDPIQYDELRIGHDEGAVEIVVYNRVIPCSPFLHFLLNALVGLVYWRDPMRMVWHLAGPLAHGRSMPGITDVENS